MYISHSAGTMVTAKSMELTNEIRDGWLDAFAVSKKYLPVVMYNAVDARGWDPNPRHVRKPQSLKARAFESHARSSPKAACRRACSARLVLPLPPSFGQHQDQHRYNQ